MKDAELAQFQSQLLESLANHSDPEVIQAELQQAIAALGPEAIEQLSHYVADFDPAMVATAAQLVQQWGRRYSA